MAKKGKPDRSSRIRGRSSKAARGGVKRRQKAAEGIAARAKERGGEPPAVDPSAIDSHARDVLRNLKIDENRLTLGLARQHAQLLATIDAGYAKAGGDGRAIGAIGTMSKQATAVLEQLVKIGDRMRETAPAPSPAAGGAPAAPASNLRPELQRFASDFDAPIGGK